MTGYLTKSVMALKIQDLGNRNFSGFNFDFEAGEHKLQATFCLPCVLCPISVVKSKEGNFIFVQTAGQEKGEMNGWEGRSDGQVLLKKSVGWMRVMRKFIFSDRSEETFIVKSARTSLKGTK